MEPEGTKRVVVKFTEPRELNLALRASGIEVRSNTMLVWDKKPGPQKLKYLLRVPEELSKEHLSLILRCAPEDIEEVDDSDEKKIKEYKKAG